MRDRDRWSKAMSEAAASDLTGIGARVIRSHRRRRIARRAAATIAAAVGIAAVAAALLLGQEVKDLRRATWQERAHEAGLHEKAGCDAVCSLAAEIVPHLTAANAREMDPALAVSICRVLGRTGVGQEWVLQVAAHHPHKGTRQNAAKWYAVMTPGWRNDPVARKILEDALIGD